MIEDSRLRYEIFADISSRLRAECPHLIINDRYLDDDRYRRGVACVSLPVFYVGLNTGGMDKVMDPAGRTVGIYFNVEYIGAIYRGDLYKISYVDPDYYEKLKAIILGIYNG